MRKQKMILERKYEFKRYNDFDFLIVMYIEIGMVFSYIGCIIALIPVEIRVLRMFLVISCISYSVSLIVYGFTHRKHVYYEVTKE